MSEEEEQESAIRLSYLFHSLHKEDFVIAVVNELQMAKQTASIVYEALMLEWETPIL